VSRFTKRRGADAPPPGMIPADRRATEARRQAAARVTSPVSDAQRELELRRDHLTERFALMQSDLGGAFYEMAIRHHVRMDVLTAKAAELQRVDAELADAQRRLRAPGRTPGDDAGQSCPACATLQAADARFCSACGFALPADEAHGGPPLTRGGAVA
jgi:hypothetical protein